MTEPLSTAHQSQSGQEDPVRLKRVVESTNVTPYHFFRLEMLHYSPPDSGSVMLANVTRCHLERFSFTHRDANWTGFVKTFSRIL